MAVQKRIDTLDVLWACGERNRYRCFSSWLDGWNFSSPEVWASFTWV